MNKHEEHFSPDNIDQQIEQLTSLPYTLTTTTTPTEQQHNPDVTLVATLHYLYTDELDRTSLNRVRQRLTDKHSTQPHAEEPLSRALDTSSDQEVGSYHSRPDGPVRRKATGIPRLLSIIAAVIIVGLLVSSWAAVMELTRHLSSAGTPTTENIYFGTSGMVYKLNGRTGAVLWQEHIPTPGGLQIKVANGIAYALQYQNLYALNTSNGRVIWHQTASAKDAYVSMQIANNTVYIYGQFYTGNGKIPGLNFMALNARDGSVRWHNTTVNTGAGEWFTVQHGAIYVQDETQLGTYAIDATTGKLRWHSHEMQGYGVHFTQEANGVVYNVSGGHLYALDEQSGQQLWTRQVPNSDVFATPYVANGIIYINSAELQQQADYETHNIIHAFDAKTGTPVWTSAPGYQRFEHVPTIDGLLLTEYSMNGVHTLNTLTAKDGKRRWQVTGSCQQRDCYAKAMVSQGTYYVFESKTDSMTVTETLTALDVQSGKKLSQRSIPGFYLHHSDVYQGIVYLISKINDPNQKNWQVNNSIYALELSTDVLLWQHAFDTRGESMNENNSFIAP